jgi:hypothetical protein
VRVEREEGREGNRRKGNDFFYDKEGERACKVRKAQESQSSDLS